MALSYLILSKYSTDVEIILSRQQFGQGKLMQPLNEDKFGRSGAPHVEDIIQHASVHSRIPAALQNRRYVMERRDACAGMLPAPRERTVLNRLKTSFTQTNALIGVFIF